MSDSINVTIRMDRNIKQQAEDMFGFDPFYSEKNQARLRESIAQYKAGKMTVKTMDELEAMEDE